MLRYILLCSLTLQTCLCHPAPCMMCMPSCVAGYSPLPQWLSSPTVLYIHLAFSCISQGGFSAYVSRCPASMAVSCMHLKKILS